MVVVSSARGCLVARSMTGFGRGKSASPDGWLVWVEIRTVNGRYLDLSLRLPSGWGEAEERLRAICRQRVLRGRCEVTVTATPGAAGPALTVDFALCEQYHRALRTIADRCGVDPATDAGRLLSLPGVVRLETGTPDPSAALPLASAALVAALDALDRVRDAEGSALRSDVEQRLADLEGLVARLSERLPEQGRAAALAWRGRVGDLVAALGGRGAPDEQRLLLEAGIWAERSDISEEIVRVTSHLAQLRAALSAQGSVGRRCDFLAQELYREWNTIGSKALDPAVTAVAVEGKTLVEQVREQLQNVE